MNRRRLLLILMFLLVVSSLAGGRPRAEGPQARKKAKASKPSLAECELLEEQARVEMLAGNDLRAMPYILEAARRGCDSPALRLLTNELLERYRTDFDIPGGRVVTYLPDGRTTVLAGKGVKRIDLLKKKSPGVRGPHFSGPINVTVLDISDDGHWCAFADSDNLLRVMNLETENVHFLSLGDDLLDIEDIDVSDHGDRIAVWVRSSVHSFGERSDVIVFDGERKVLEIPGEGKFFHRIRIAPDGKHVLVGYWITDVESGKTSSAFDVWDIQSGRKTFSRRLEAGWRLWDFSPDGNRLIVLMGTAIFSSLKLNDARYTEVKSPPNFPYWTIASSPDGREIAFLQAFGPSVPVLDATTGKTTAYLENHAGPQKDLFHVGWDDTTNFIATCSAIQGVKEEYQEVGEVSLWNPINGKQLLSWTLPGLYGWRVWLRNGRLIFRMRNDLVIKPVSTSLSTFEEVNRVLSPYLVYRLEGNTTLVPVATETNRE